MRIEFISDSDEWMTWAGIKSTYYPDTLISVYGKLTPVFSGTVSNVQNYDSSSGQEGQITCDELPVSWTDSGFLSREYICVITSGDAEGATFFPIKDLGSKRARISRCMFSVDFDFSDIANGDTFEIYQLTALSGYHNFS